MGIMLEYEKSGELKTKSIDLLNLSSSTDVNALVEEIQKAEPLITASRSDQVKLLIQRLQDKLRQHSNHKFYLFKEAMIGHVKSGTLHLEKSFTPWRATGIDKIATGSFDKTCKLWSAETGKCYHTFRGHTAEIVCLSFNPQSTLVATGSMDTTAKLWDIQNGEEVFTLTGHSAEIISLSFNTLGNRIITGSFDHTVAVWEADTGRKVYTLIGHCAEISSALFNWDCSLILTGSMDKTCMLWDATNGKCVATLTGHDDEILDSCFDYTGKLIATASADGTARVFSAATRKCITKLEGHEGEISKISFNPQGNHLLTGSADKTARIWDAQTGQCLQILEGHTDEIFSCAFNYKGNIIITGSLVHAHASHPRDLILVACGTTRQQQSKAGSPLILTVEPILQMQGGVLKSVQDNENKGEVTSMWFFPVFPEECIFLQWKMTLGVFPQAEEDLFSRALAHGHGGEKSSEKDLAGASQLISSAGLQLHKFVTPGSKSTETYNSETIVITTAVIALLAAGAPTGRDQRGTRQEPSECSFGSDSPEKGWSSALSKKPGYIKLHKIWAAQNISKRIATSQNLIHLTTDNLVLNLQDESFTRGSWEEAITTIPGILNKFLLLMLKKKKKSLFAMNLARFCRESTVQFQDSFLDSRLDYFTSNTSEQRRKFQRESTAEMGWGKKDLFSADKIVTGVEPGVRSLDGGGGERGRVGNGGGSSGCRKKRQSWSRVSLFRDVNDSTGPSKTLTHIKKETFALLPFLLPSAQH
ncbi:hypothetical protein GH733_008366 [Mirounga leonina]|nr:hypothetical protein GH733_008366 [Mirounga leonina]